jgi:hypothetical protein
MEKLNLEYSRPSENVEEWTDMTTGRVVKKREEFPETEEETVTSFGYSTESIFDNEGLIHSFNDAPAVIRTCTKTGEKTYQWRLHGLLHRENGPAYSGPICDHWLLNGKHSRPNNLPTVVYSSGLELWRGRTFRLSISGPSRLYVARKNGVLGYLKKTTKGTNIIKFTDGSVIFLNEEHQIHADGFKPAIVWADGTKEWYDDGAWCYPPSN